MSSSAILRRVAPVRADVSEECITSVIRITRIGELGIFVETSVLTRATRRNIPEDDILYSRRRENIKSFIA
jgi:hypothetical protein